MKREILAPSEEPTGLTMGGYVTNARDCPGYVLADRFHYDQISRFGTVYTANGFPDPASSHQSAWQRPRQVTTSYRSSGGDSDELLFAGGSTWAARRKALATYEAKRETAHDNGHDFDTWRQDYFPMTHGTVVAPDGYQATGPLVPSFPVVAYPSIPPNLESLRALGQVGIRNTTPTNSPADLAQALIELKREGLPALIGQQSLSRQATGRKAGGEYLNFEFGIKPILRDVQDTLSAVRNSSEILTKYQEEAGRKIHRQYTFPTEKYTDVEVYQSSVSNYPALLRNGYFNNGVGTLTDTTETTIRSWFSGAYTYYLQSDNIELNRLHVFAEKAKYLLGLELTPELLWEVSPWSWLADWVGNIGVNISNATALSQDGLVLRYGYIMRETTVRRFRTLDGLQPRVVGNPTSVSDVFVTQRKQRIRATPYGFGLNPSTFSGRQWAILGALGLTRGNKSLRYND